MSIEMAHYAGLSYEDYVKEIPKGYKVPTKEKFLKVVKELKEYDDFASFHAKYQISAMKDETYEEYLSTITEEEKERYSTDIPSKEFYERMKDILY